MTEEVLRQILDKCEQYWNDPNVSVEMHAVLEFIHVRALGIETHSKADRDKTTHLTDVIRCAIVDLSDAAAMYGGSDGRPDMLKKVMLDNVTALKKALDWPMEAKA